MSFTSGTPEFTPGFGPSPSAFTVRRPQDYGTVLGGYAPARNTGGIQPDATWFTATLSGATSATVNITAATAGSWVYLWTALPGATTAASATGWTQLASSLDASATPVAYTVLRRQKQAGDTTFTVTWTGSSKGVLAWVSYTGLNQDTPDEGAAAASNSTTSRTAVPTPSATPAAGNRAAVAFFAVRTSTLANNNIAWTPDRATTERFEANNDAAPSAPWAGSAIADTLPNAVAQSARSYTATHGPAAEAHDGSAILFLIPAPAPPQFLTRPAVSPQRVNSPFRSGQYFNPGQFSVPALPPLVFTRQAQSARLSLRRSEGQYFGLGLGQANQGVQFPLFLRQRALSPRTVTVVRPSRGQFFNQAWGQGNQGVTFPLYLRQAGNASRWTLRRSHGTFFQQAWGQANQGTRFPLFTRQAGNASRWTLRRSQGRFFTPGQFNLDGNPWPSFTRQAGVVSRWTLRRSYGTFFNQAWGQANRGTAFPLFTRQPGNSSRWTLRNPRGKFSAVTVSAPAVPPPQFITRQERPAPSRIPRGRYQVPGLGQANQGAAFPLYMRQAEGRRLTLRRSQGRFSQVPAFIPVIPPPQFITRQQRPVPLRIQRGRFQVPGLGQGNQGTAFPSFTRQAGTRTRFTRAPRGRLYGLPQIPAVFPPPQYLRPAGSVRFAARLLPSRRRAWGPALPQAAQGQPWPSFIRQPGVRPRRLDPRSSPRRQRYCEPPWPLPAPQTPVFRAGTARFQWETEVPGSRWAAGTPRA